jgi:hypothetical protein
VITLKVFLAINPLGPAASSAHECQHGKTIIAKPMCLG